MTFVISLEDVFVDDESEQDDCLLQHGFDLVVRFLQKSGNEPRVYRSKEKSRTYAFETLLEIIVNEE
jgi:hypothetical protein